MTLEQLKERVEATCNKNGIFPINISISRLGTDLYAAVHLKNGKPFVVGMPSADLLLEAVDLECRAIKARQSSATNGID